MINLFGWMSRCKAFQEGTAIPTALKYTCACLVKRTRHTEPGTEFKGESSERINHVEFWIFCEREEKPLKSFK